MPTPPQTKPLSDSIVEKLHLPVLLQILKINNFRKNYPNEAKLIDYDAEKIKAAKFENRDDRLELVNMKLEEEKQKIKAAEEAKKMAGEDKNKK